MNGHLTPNTTESEARPPRALGTLLLWALGAGMLFCGFVALGSWQIHRLSWKRELIERVDQRVHAPASDLPSKRYWQDINAQSDEYRHVKISGVFLHQFSTRVHASTRLGRGFWLLTPLRTSDGSVIWINRGFVAFSSGPEVATNSFSSAVNVSGLLRMNEPKGTVLNRNQPDRQQWFSRDVAAMSVKYQLINAAPFFIDAEATPMSDTCRTGMCADHPVGGLTVIAFDNNHLVYSVTWFALALMVAVACYILGRTEQRLRRDVLERNSD